MCVSESITKCNDNTSDAMYVYKQNIINMGLTTIYHDNSINKTYINICIEYQSYIMNTLSTTLDSTALVLSAS